MWLPAGTKAKIDAKIVDPVTERLPSLVPGQISTVLSWEQLSKLSSLLLHIRLPQKGSIIIS